MKKANLVLMAALAAAGLTGVVGGSLLPVSVAVAAEKEKAPKQKLPMIIDDGKVFALAPKSSIMELPADGGFPSDGGR